MKKLLLWLVMVIFMVAALLGGVIGFMYFRTGPRELPQEQPSLGEVALESIGYSWQLPVLGGVVNKPYAQPSTLTVQKLGDFGDTAPQLMLPEWTTRSAVTLTAPDGSVVLQGDAGSFNSYPYAQNGQYKISLTLYQDDTGEGMAKADGWYQYAAAYTINLQPKAALSESRVSQGAVVAVSVTGILGGGTPSIETDLGTVWFRQTTEGFMGYIPVTYNAESGEHTLNLTCGSLSQQLTLTVTQASAQTIEQGPASETPAGAETEYQNAIWPLYTSAKPEKLWSGAFSAPSTAAISASYGSNLMAEGVRNGRATGLYYAAEAGSEVCAPQSGTVVFAGNLALTGGTVVIDHGCGVKSYLYGLDTVAVQRGQAIEKALPVGTASAEHQLIFELRIGSKSVDPAPAVAGTSGLQSRENT